MIREFVEVMLDALAWPWRWLRGCVRVAVQRRLGVEAPRPYRPVAYGVMCQYRLEARTAREQGRRESQLVISDLEAKLAAQDREATQLRARLDEKQDRIWALLIAQEQEIQRRAARSLT